MERIKKYCEEEIKRASHRLKEAHDSDYYTDRDEDFFTTRKETFEEVLGKIIKGE